MGKVKFDGVVEAAHYKSDGQIDWVRVYERRGAVFSDRLILSREAFIRQLRAGKRYMIGERIPKMGGMFNTTQPVHLLNQDGQQVIVVGDSLVSRDELSGVPIV
jgi:hypothetical protein